jgi:DNA-binding protein
VNTYILTAKEHGMDNEISVIAKGKSVAEAIQNAWLMPEWVVTEVDYEQRKEQAEELKREMRRKDLEEDHYFQDME